MLRRKIAAGNAILVCVTITTAPTSTPPPFPRPHRQNTANKSQAHTRPPPLQVRNTRLNLSKRRQGPAVDAQGVATLQLALSSLMQEMTNAKGDTLLFDSANLDKSTPDLKDQMSRYVGKPLAVLRVDGYGRVVE